MGYDFLLAARNILYAPPTDKIVHSMAFVILVVEREIDRWIHYEEMIHRTMSECPSRSFFGLKCGLK